MHTTFDALSNKLAIFQLELMVFWILALRMCTFMAFLFDDVITFYLFSSQSKCYLDIEYNEIGLMSLMLFIFSQSMIEKF